MAISGRKLKKLSEETIYLGLGLAVLAKEELEAVIAYLSKKGRPLAEGYAKTKRELIENGKEEFEVLKTFMEGKKKKQSSPKKKR